MGNGSRMRVGRWVAAGAVVATIGVWKAVSKQYGWEGDRDAALQVLKEMSDRLGMWAIPAYVGLHTLTLALCLPYAVFLEAGASLLFGFLPAVLCVFSAKVLAASLSFWIGRFIGQIITFNLQQTITHPSIPHVDGINNPPTILGNTQFGVALVYPPSIPLVGLFILPAIVVFGFVFRSSSSAMEWAQRNKYFHLLSKGVEQDGWRFVLLARFSPIPSYVINYALAATGVGFAVDFLLPTVIGCLPMILQNTSIGSLAGAAVASATGGSQKSQVWSYILPLLGVVSSIVISLRVKKYATNISVEDNNGSNNNVDSSKKTLSGSKGSKSSNQSHQ